MIGKLDTLASEQARAHAARYGKEFLDGRDDPEIASSVHETPSLPTAVYLVYGGASGDSTQRVVTFLSAWQTDGIVYFKARCHLRHALRTFRADKVEELICLATGEVPDDPARWILEHALFEGELQADYTHHALRACRDELALLAYVGAADGMFDPDEVEVAIDYVMMSTERLIDRDRAARYLRRLSPSLPDIADHVRALSRHPERWPKLTRAMRRLVDADRVVSAEEQVAWSQLSEQFNDAVTAREDAERQSLEREFGSALSSSRIVLTLDLNKPEFRAMIAAAMRADGG